MSEGHATLPRPMRLPFAIAVLASTLIGSSAAADVRSYAGGLSTRWKTVGWHGHDQPLCPAAEGGTEIVPSNCNDSDFLRANLDNSIGFRAGRESDSFRHGPLTFTLGGEAEFVDTEYNLSQDHVALFAAAATAGIDYQLFGGRIGARYGAGPFVTSDGRWGLEGLVEIAGMIPLRSGAAVRVAHRSVNLLFRYDGPEPGYGGLESLRRGETSILLVAAPHGAAPSRWEFSAAAGVSAPGAGYGASLDLRRAAWQRLAVLYSTSNHSDLQLQASWTAAAHESTALTTFLGFPGNQRGKTIDSLGVGIRHRRPLMPALSFHYGGGVEVADFADEHSLLMRDGEELRGGLELGVAAGAALRAAVAPHAAIEGTLEQIYWRGIGLGELRWGVGLVITR